MFFKKKKAILFIHGFIGGTYDFSRLPNELQLYNDFDVFTFTLPAHDKLIVKNVTYEDWINEAKKQIDFLIENNRDNIYIIGHSMGGVIATHLAKEYPKYIKKIVLVAPAFRYFYFKDGKINLKNISESLKNINDLFQNIETEKVIERIAKTPIQSMIEFAKLVDNYQEDVKKITCPILTIRGTLDNIVPYESVSFVHNNVLSKSNILININNVTHDCFTQKRSDEINKIITNFLKNPVKEKKEEKNI